MRDFRKNMFNYFAVLLGFVTLICFGFNALGGVSGWQTIRFDSSTEITFSSLFALFAIIIGIALLFLGTIGVYSNYPVEDKFSTFCKKADDKLKIQVWGKWLIVAYTTLILLYLICIGCFASDVSDAYYKISLGWGPFLILFISLVALFFTMFFPMFTKTKQEDTKEAKDEAKDEPAKKQTKSTSTKKTTTNKTSSKSTGAKKTQNKKASK